MRTSQKTPNCVTPIVEQLVCLFANRLGFLFSCRFEVPPSCLNTPQSTSRTNGIPGVAVIADRFFQWDVKEGTTFLKKVLIISHHQQTRLVFTLLPLHCLTLQHNYSRSQGEPKIRRQLIFRRSRYC